MNVYKAFHVRVPKEIYDKLKVYSETKGLSYQSLFLSAIEDYVGEKEPDLNLVRKDLYELKRRLIGVRGDVEVLGELLSFFIYHWLGYTPRLEQSERATLALEAKERHKKFMELFAKKLAVGELSLERLLALGAESEPDPELENEPKA